MDRAPTGLSSETWAEETLRRLGQAEGFVPGDLTDGALALAVFDAPSDRVDFYRDHIGKLCSDLATVLEPGATAEAAREALSHVLYGLHGYSGDQETYDDLQNANLIRVIDRRKGLPVALGILMIDLARSAGLAMDGLDFPGHFLLRLDVGGERMIIDPFHTGVALDAAALRGLLKLTSGADAELHPDHYEPTADRDILLRLQNNIKMRLIKAQRVDQAIGIVESMLLLAPDRAVLWREAGMMNAHIGNVKSALSALETYIDREERAAPRQEAEGVIAELRARLN